MTKEFIPYEEALALKELGFNEECFAVYSEKGVLSPITNLKPCNSNVPSYATAPLYQQAFRWFREKHNFIVQIGLACNGNHYVVIHKTTEEYLAQISGLSNPCFEEIVDLYSYEEAELACLRKLIEIVKEKQL